MSFRKIGEGEKNPAPVYTHRCPQQEGYPIMTPHKCQVRGQNLEEYPECWGCLHSRPKPKVARVPYKKEKQDAEEQD